MARYFLKLSYNGAPYHGWQTQPNAVSVQQTIEEALGRYVGSPTPIIGAGRTDTGVNARVMYAHVDLPERYTEAAEAAGLVRALNSMVGRDIAIDRLIRVADDAHARFDATSRTYHYYVHHRKDPFIEAFSLQSHPLDYEAMNVAAARLLQVSDFTSFAKLHSDAKTNICRVSRAEWQPIGDGRHRFVIRADRFLRNMVRAVVGTLVEVGRGKMSIEGFDDVISQRDRCSAGTSMPAHALFLWDITYSYITPEGDAEQASLTNF